MPAVFSRGCSADGASRFRAGPDLSAGIASGRAPRRLVRRSARASACLFASDRFFRRGVCAERRLRHAAVCAVRGTRRLAAVLLSGHAPRFRSLLPAFQPLDLFHIFPDLARFCAISSRHLCSVPIFSAKIENFFQKTLCKIEKMVYNILRTTVRMESQAEGKEKPPE